MLNPPLVLLERNPERIGLRTVPDLQSCFLIKRPRGQVGLAGRETGLLSVTCTPFPQLNLFYFCPKHCSSLPWLLLLKQIFFISYCPCELHSPNTAGTQSLSTGEREAALPQPPEALDHLSGECLAPGKAWKYWRAITPWAEQIRKLFTSPLREPAAVCLSVQLKQSSVRKSEQQSWL